jgi:hypothetical protein
LPEGLHKPDVGVGGRAVWVGVEVGGGEVNEGVGGELGDVGDGTGVLLTVVICEVAGGVVGGDVQVIVGEGAVVQVAPVVPMAVGVGDGLAVDVPGVPDGVVDPVGVGDAVMVSAGCDAIVVESAGRKGVGDGASEERLSEVGIRSKP